MHLEKRRKLRQFSPREEDDVGRWLFSYADMMTLLMAFFVLLVALSNLDPVKLQIVSQSLSDAMKGTQSEPRVTLSQIQSDLEVLIKKEGMGSQVDVNRDKHGVALSLRGSSFFESGSTELLGPAVPFLTMVASEIEQVPYQIAIEGHTDDVPISSDQFPSNWELSSARAAKVVRFFVERGLPVNRFQVVGYADTKPADPALGNLSPEDRARNRRVVVLFLDSIGG